MYNYYVNTGCPIIQISPDVEIKKVTPRINRNIHTFIWTIFSKCFNLKKYRHYVEYQLLINRGGVKEVVSTAEVVSWLPIFPFMPRKALEIGPCYTDKNYRGNGYYPMLLKRIREDFPDRELCILVNVNNKSSIRGVQKAGFESFAKGRKTRMGRYIIEK